MACVERAIRPAMTSTSKNTSGSTATEEGQDDAGVAYIRDSDVLCGRGNLAKHPGNRNFLNIVSKRKESYKSTLDPKVKAHLAREVLDELSQSSDPPPRFLAPMDGVTVKPAELLKLSMEQHPGSDRGEQMPLWRLLDEEEIMAKVKMTLRQKPKKRKKQLDPTETAGQSSAEDLKPPAIDNENKVERDAFLDMLHVERYEDDGVSSGNDSGVLDDLERLFDSAAILASELEPPLLASSAMEPEPIPMACAGSLPLSVGSSGPVTAQVSSGPEPEADATNTSRDRILGLVSIAHQIVQTKLLSLSANGSNDNDQREELFGLGEELYRLFAGCKPFENMFHGTSSSAENERWKKRREESLRPSNDSTYKPLLDLGFPSSVSNVVSNLLDMELSKGASVYRTVNEVEEDLMLMINDPERHLFDPSVSTMPQLDIGFSSRLYGQDDNVQKLMDAFQRVLANSCCSESLPSCEAVLLAGRSGTGKTALVRHAQGPITTKGGCVIYGKFDENRKGQPLSAIIDALEEWCDILLREGVLHVLAVRESLRAAIGDDVHILMNLVQGLARIVGKPKTIPAFTTGGRQAQNQLVYLFGRLLGVIARPSKPLVLFLDDLQWADDFSLELIRSFVCDAYLGSLLILGTYRDDEVVQDLPFSMFLDNLVSTRSSLKILEIGNMDKDTVNVLVSDALHMSPRLTKPLSSTIYHRTGGNGLFVVQFLVSLRDEGLITFSLLSRQWEWDLDAIKERHVADDVVDLLAAKMQKLDEQVLWGLKTASCLGSQCDEFTVRYLGNAADVCADGISSLLNAAIEEGLMMKTGSVYSFVHDAIQDAAYCLIPEDERKTMHLKIGNALCERVPPDDLDMVIFIAVDQMLRGADLITSHDEIIRIAHLALRAGQTAMAASTFVSALLYLLPAIDHLKESDWTDNYDLILQLHSSAIEACFVAGKYDELQDLAKEVVLKATCPMHKMRVYRSLANTLSCQGKGLDAIDLSFRALSQVGELFPRNLNDDAIVAGAIVQINAMMEGIVLDDVLSMKKMQDQTKLEVMDLLANLAAYAYHASSKSFPVIISRMIEITLSHGICDQSSHAFAMGGSVLCQSPENIPKGYRIGKIALALLNQSNARNLAARVSVTVHCLINIFVEPMQAAAEEFKQGYEIGISVGDIEYANSHVLAFGSSCTYSGTNLSAFKEQMSLYERRMGNSKAFLRTCQAYEFFARSLMGETEDDLDFRSSNGEDLLVELKKMQSRNCLGLFYMTKMTLAYIYNQYNLAAEMADKRRLTTSSGARNGTVIHETFYSALIALASASGDEGESFDARCTAEESLSKLNQWLIHSEWNLNHRVQLLKAEIAFHDGHMDDAAELYDEAIRVAGEHRFVNEQAIACERCGIFYSSSGNMGSAKNYFIRAIEYYTQWGATRKASYLSERLRYM